MSRHLDLRDLRRCHAQKAAEHGSLVLWTEETRMDDTDALIQRNEAESAAATAAFEQSQALVERQARRARRLRIGRVAFGTCTVVTVLFAGVGLRYALAWFLALDGNVQTVLGALGIWGATVAWIARKAAKDNPSW